MFDINLLRNDLAATAERMKARNFIIDTAGFEALEAERKALQIQTQEPVSYTHLDVYKRQDAHGVEKIAVIGQICERA